MELRSKCRKGGPAEANGCHPDAGDCLFEGELRAQTSAKVSIGRRHRQSRRGDMEGISHRRSGSRFPHSRTGHIRDENTGVGRTELHELECLLLARAGHLLCGCLSPWCRQSPPRPREALLPWKRPSCVFQMIVPTYGTWISTTGAELALTGVNMLQRAKGLWSTSNRLLRCPSDEIAGCEFVLQVGIVDRSRN
jgi:hypothetical protein